MDALVEHLNAKLYQWQPDIAEQVKARHWFSLMIRIAPNAYHTRIAVFSETNRRDPCH